MPNDIENIKMNTKDIELLNAKIDALKYALKQLNVEISQLAKSQEELGQSIRSNSKFIEDFSGAALNATKAFQKFNSELENNASGSEKAEKANQKAAKSIEKFNKQLNDNAKEISKANNSIESGKAALEDLESEYADLLLTQKLGAKEAESFSAEIDGLSKSITDQEEAVKNSEETFDFHAKSIDAIKSATDKLTESNEDFGPIVEDVTEGFNMMKDGLSLVKTGFQSVGGAIKATGFGILVFVLQSLVEYFTKTTDGAKKLKGGIAAINLVIKTVKDYVSSILKDVGGGIVDAFCHPADTIKKIWNGVIDNLKSRFKGISVFFKGLFSGNLKEMGNGLIQMGTGVTDGVDKITHAVKSAASNLKDFGKKVVDAYEEGTKASDKATKRIVKNNKKIANSIKAPARQSYEELTEPKKSDPTFNNSQTKVAPDKIEPLKNLPDSKPIQTIIDDAHAKKDWKIEFALKKEQLNQEHILAVESARKKNESVLKVDQEFKDKQKALEKAKLEAQFENQQKYVKSVDSLSNTLTSIAGKNTVAAKVAFKAHQAAAAGQVVIDTEKAIMGIWAADAPLPFIGIAKAIAETAVAGAAGAASITSILKQKPGFAQGGQYHSDGRGALLAGYSRTDDTNAYLRSGEAVVVSEAMRNPWARNLVSAINVAHGGRDFSVSNPGRGYAIGGIFTDGGNANRYYSQPVNDAKDLANTLAYQMINNFPPIYVDVKDVNNQQNILAQTVNRVNL